MQLEKSRFLSTDRNKLREKSNTLMLKNKHLEKEK